MVDVLCVAPDQVDVAWPLVDRHITAAVSYAATVDINVMRSKLRTGANYLWLICEGKNVLGGVVTTLERANDVKLCTIIACGGDQLEAWRHLIGKIESWARSEGCHRMSIWGRPGWERMLDGYCRKAVVLEKEL